MAFFIIQVWLEKFNAGYYMILQFPFIAVSLYSYTLQFVILFNNAFNGVMGSSLTLLQDAEKNSVLLG